jgi:class 3 adenylate cyclase/tetratricopeptide (TPR) repeat protein
LAGRAALEGERKQVTILFADVVGSTELIRDRDPEDAQRLLDGAVRLMMTAIHRYEGTVSRLMGDGLMAMFGAPVAHEDHAIRACYAALAMLDSCRAYANDVRKTHGAAIQIRVGINSGEVIVRLISDDLHMDYTAMGQTVHLASRLEGLANIGTALLAPTAQSLVQGFVDTRALGPISVKGLDQPLEVFELVGVGAVRTRLQVAAVRGLTRFVGRERELELARGALERVGDGLGQVVALVGEPGVGKSRLIHEVTASSSAANWLMLRIGAVSYGKATSYLPIVDLLKSFCRIEPGEDGETMRERVTSRIQTLDRALDTVVTPLLALLDLPTEDASWDALDPPRRRRATLDAVKRLLLRQSREQPLLLVVEDLHWIDAETRVLLDELVDSLPSARILLLVSYRPEFRHEWMDRDYFTELRIDPLPTGSTDELLTDLLGDDPALRPVMALLTARTDGNPLFLEEAVRTLVETGALVGERGGYRLTRPVTDVQVPATVQAVLAARIDRLAAAEKRLLQTAAVIGKDVPFDLLQAIADQSDGADLQLSLLHLQAAELVYPVGQFPEPEYTFKHALTHEVAYGGLLHDRCRELHGRIVDAVERLYPDRLTEHVERLAHHTLRAEAWEKALMYGRQAGSRDMSRSALREAATWFEGALFALRRLPESSATMEQAIDVSIDLRGALNQLGESRRAFGFLEEAKKFALQLGDRRRLARVLISTNSYHYMSGAADSAVVVSQQALTIGTELGDLALQAAALHCLGQDRFARGEFQLAVHHFTRALEHMAGESGGPRELIGSSSLLAQHTRSCLAWALAELGECAEANAIADDAGRVAAASGHLGSVMASLIYRGLVRVRTGDPREAIPLLERGRDLMYEMNLQGGIAFGGMCGALGDAYVQVGRLDDALPLLERVRTHNLNLNNISDYFIGAVPLGEAYRLAGRHAEALRLTVEAVDLATKVGERGSQARALRVLAEVQADHDRHDLGVAERTFREALSLAEALEMRPLQAHCHLDLGKLYRRVGRMKDARAELSTAVNMLREMEMTFWLPEAEAELAHAVPSTPTDGASEYTTPTPPSTI